MGCQMINIIPAHRRAIVIWSILLDAQQMAKHSHCRVIRHTLA